MSKAKISASLLFKSSVVHIRGSSCAIVADGLNQVRIQLALDIMQR